MGLEDTQLFRKFQAHDHGPCMDTVASLGASWLASWLGWGGQIVGVVSVAGLSNNAIRE